MGYTQDYSLFLKFIDKFSPLGFRDVDADDTLMLELEKLMDKNKQFLYVADALHMKILFISKHSHKLIGVQPEELSFYHFMEATHQDDLQRLNIGRAKLIKLAQDIFLAKKGKVLMSTNFRIRNAGGEYSQFLIQGYLFYTTIPYETVFFIKIHTKIDWCKKIKHGYHYYIGDDMSYFRYPDKELLNMGNILTGREFEIVKMIATGQSSEQIAKALFLSIYTVNTHRGNILKKTGKAHISELIYDLQERGLL